MPLPPSEQSFNPFPTVPFVGQALQRLSKYLPSGSGFGGGMVQAQAPQATPLKPFADLPSFPPLAGGVSEPPQLHPGGAYGELPPSAGTSHGWLEASPGTHFDSSVLAGPPPPVTSEGTVTSPSGSVYTSALHGSIADLEGQIRTKSYLDELFPELTPQGRLAGAEMEAKTRAITPLRPGEEAPRLMSEALAERKKDAAMQQMTAALSDWQHRKDAAVQALTLKGANLAKADFDRQRLSLEDAFDQERQTIRLRYAPELVPGLRAGMQDLE